MTTLRETIRLCELRDQVWTHAIFGLGQPRLDPIAAALTVKEGLSRFEEFTNTAQRINQTLIKQANADANEIALLRNQLAQAKTHIEGLISWVSHAGLEVNCTPCRVVRSAKRFLNPPKTNVVAFPKTTGAVPTFTDEPRTA